MALTRIQKAFVCEACKEVGSDVLLTGKELTTKVTSVVYSMLGKYTGKLNGYVIRVIIRATRTRLCYLQKKKVEQVSEAEFLFDLQKEAEIRKTSEEDALLLEVMHNHGEEAMIHFKQHGYLP
jgi:hypothetical protein